MQSDITTTSVVRLKYSYLFTDFRETISFEIWIRKIFEGKSGDLWTNFLHKFLDFSWNFFLYKVCLMTGVESDESSHL